MGDVLAFVEQRDGTVKGVAREVVTAAASVAGQLGGAAHALAVGASAPAGLDALGGFGAASIKVVANEAFAGHSPEHMAAAIAEVVRSGGYAAVFFGATAQGKDLAPRVAALLDVPLAGDVTGIEVEGGSLVFTRPVYSGKAFAKVKLAASPAVASLRPNVFAPAENAAGGVVENVTVAVDAGRPASKVVSFEAAGGDLDVSEASVVISGGRGMKDPEQWGVLEALRDAIGNDVAALGASRAVVDAGWRPHGEQVGQTGKTVSPQLYFAVGISGAIQHLAGMRSAGTIVAINKDADAPIFQVADYGIVGDLFEVVPAVTAAVQAIKAD